MALIESVVGHKSQIKNLKFAIAENKLPHALIFSGPNSIGKKKCAIAIAQILICEDQNARLNAEACGQCGSCKRTEKNQSENLKIISPDGASIKADQVRDVLDYLSLSNFGKNRVIIFDQAHVMNAVAANSLLKTLEEPNPNVYFILIGPEISNFMTTIKSRSQVIRFSSLTIEQLQIVKPGQPTWAYSCARGQVDSLLQLTAEDGQKHREECLIYLEQFFSDKEFLFSDEFKKSVKDREQARIMLQIWNTMLRDVLILKTTAQKFVLNLDQPNRLKKLFQITTEKISNFTESLLQADRDLVGNGDAVLIFESLWVRYARQ